jgi:hypothetical protein
MTEISQQARDLVDEGREAFRPTEADRARVLAAVLSAAPLIGGTTIVGVSKASVLEGLVQLVRGSRLAQLVAITMPVAAAGGVLWYATVGQPLIRPTTPRPAGPTGVAISSPATQPASDDAPAPQEDVPGPASEQAAVPPSERPAASTSDSRQFSQEVALLSRAQAELSRGRAQQALDALKEHANRFPRGALTNERIATRARALCALGRTREAGAELDRMERLDSRSPYWARAREACRGK